MRDVFDWLPTNRPATITKGGNEADVMAGGEGRDILFGRGGNDLLIGDPDVNSGGSRDILVGGQGADHFHFQFIPTIARDSDVILSFKPSRDAIVLDFDFLPADPDKPKYGAYLDKLDPESFVVGNKAKDADDFVIYRKKTGALFIDVDGNGAGEMHKIAIFANKADLKAGDIIIA